MFHISTYFVFQTYNLILEMCVVYLVIIIACYYVICYTGRIVRAGALQTTNSSNQYPTIGLQILSSIGLHILKEEIELFNSGVL